MWLLAAIVTIAWHQGRSRLLAFSALGLAAYLAVSTPLGANLRLHGGAPGSPVRLALIPHISTLEKSTEALWELAARLAT